MRLADWRTRLTLYLAERARQPFAPGSHDCALFAAGAVEAITGTDPAAPYRGRYTTERGGLRVLRRDGYADHVALAAATLPERVTGRAAPGDLAVVDGPAGPALGVVQGAAIYVLSPRGLSLVPLAAANRIFEVG